jgi:hypothetical protein
MIDHFKYQFIWTVLTEQTQNALFDNKPRNIKLMSTQILLQTGRKKEMGNVLTAQIKFYVQHNPKFNLSKQIILHGLYSYALKISKERNNGIVELKIINSSKTQTALLCLQVKARELITSVCFQFGYPRIRC